MCFDFQKLLANKNGLIANAQMLLVLKYLENEVIKNRDYNLKNGTDRKIIVVVDEAHLFIDEKYPIALDFMYQLAKRIRKYNGMEIVITQSIKDFAGTPETARKSMAIINVSQYSLIFPLSPSDMNDLCALYEKAGQINEIEADNIVHNERGCAFLISSPESRTNIRIVATPYFEKYSVKGGNHNRTQSNGLPPQSGYGRQANAAGRSGNYRLSDRPRRYHLYRPHAGRHRMYRYPKHFHERLLCGRRSRRDSRGRAP